MRNGLRNAIVTIASTIAAFVVVYWVSNAAHAGSSPAIMAATLALTLARRPASRRASHVLFELALLPLIGLGASIVGWMLHAVPAVGAAAFVAGMFLSVWLRQFGERARRVGLLLALPFVAILVARGAPSAPGGRLEDIGLVLLAGVVALASVLLMQSLAERAGFKPAYEPERERPPVRARKAAGVSAITRTAIQLAVALAAAFAVGLFWFPQHWTWVVLTAFIVGAGSRGRGDALYKALLRLGGAAAGTAAAALLQHVATPQGVEAATVVFGVLFVGVWLRGLNYAYWAACMTLVVALLQRETPADPGALLDLRLVEILCGAVCGAAAAWFVLPVRTESVVLRRLADALAALDEAVRAGALPAPEREARLHAFELDVKQLDAVSVPVELHWRIVRAARADEHAAVWIGVMRRIAKNVRGYRGDRAELARAVRAARRALSRYAHPANEENDDEDASLAAALRRIEATLAPQSPG